MSLKKHDKTWKEKLELLQEYILLFNELPKQNTVYKGVRLGTWLHTNKQSYKNGLLSAECTELLLSAGICLDVSDWDKQWQEKYDVLKEYVEMFGHAPKTKTVYKNVRIGEWLLTNKRSFSKNTLKPHRANLLSELGIELKTTTFEEQWDKNFKTLKRYISANGCLPTRKVCFQGVALGAWLNSNKHAHKVGNLSKKREKLLRSAGVCLDGSNWDKQWNENFSLLQEYIDEFGKLPTIKTQYKTKLIGNWIAYNKRQFQRGKLSRVRESMLREVGINLGVLRKDSLEQLWHKNFETLKNYIHTFHTLPRQRENYNGVNIGAWLDTNKQKYRHGKLSKERETLIRSLGIDLDHDFVRKTHNRTKTN